MRTVGRRACPRHLLSVSGGVVGRKWRQCCRWTDLDVNSSSQPTEVTSWPLLWFSLFDFELLFALASGTVNMWTHPTGCLCRCLPF